MTWQEPANLATARRRGVGRGGRERRAERTPQEQYNGVKDFWVRIEPEERRKLLRVPVSSLLESESLGTYANEMLLCLYWGRWLDLKMLF